MNPHLLALSSSRPNRNAGLFTHAREMLKVVLSNARRLLFVSYASPGGVAYADYTAKVKSTFAQLRLPQLVEGIESYQDPKTAICKAEAVFVGGGNTFLLLKTLYENDLLEPLRERILEGVLYIGSSAGSNILGKTINTSNDMAIVHPSSLDALGILPFNVNPHYPMEENKYHSGESRAERIREFHAQSNNSQPVVALYENSMMYQKGNTLTLLGDETSTQPAAWLFLQGEMEPTPYVHGNDMSFLLT